MVLVLVDMHLAEAVLLDNQMKNKDSVQTSQLYFESIFAKYKISRPQFDESMKFYAKNPDLLNEIYDKVFEQLTTMQTKQKV